MFLDCLIRIMFSLAASTAVSNESQLLKSYVWVQSYIKQAVLVETLTNRLYFLWALIEGQSVESTLEETRWSTNSKLTRLSFEIIVWKRRYYVGTNVTMKSSCVTTRGVPPAAYWVLLFPLGGGAILSGGWVPLCCLGDTPTLSRGPQSCPGGYP